MATRKKRSTKAKPRANIVVVSRTHHRKHKKRTTRRVSGTAAVGKTRHKRKKRAVMGMTGGTLKLNDGLKMAAGVAGGIIINHKVLRPIENHLSQSAPMAAKFMGVAQAALGFAVAVKSKGMIGKAAGVTIMGGGVNAVLRQFNVEKHIPGISGTNDDWTTVKLPMSGPTELRSMVAGLLKDNETPNLPGVANTGHHRRHRATFENTSSNNEVDDYRLRSWVGDSELDTLLEAKGNFA